MKWHVCVVLIATLVLGVCAAPEANVPCPKKNYESVCSQRIGCVQVMESSEVGSLFNLSKGTGKLSISMWLKVTAGGGGLIPILDIVGRPVVDGSTVNGDRIQLLWDSAAAQLQLSVNVDGNEATVNGLGVVPLVSDRYRHLLLTMDASTGVMTVSIGSVELIRETFEAVKNNGINFSPIASFGYGTPATAASWVPFANMTLGDMSVFSGRIIDQFKAEYLSQFRALMKEDTNGCIVDTETEDHASAFKDADVHTFFFFKNDNNAGFSFNNASVTDGESTINESLFLLKSRNGTGHIELTSKSWTQEEEDSHSCGALQSAVFTYPSTPSSMLKHFAMGLVYGSQPPAGTEFAIVNEATGGTVAVFTSPMHFDTIWFTYGNGSLSFQLRAGGGFKDFCIASLNGYDVGSALADPHVTYYEQESTITFYTGIRAGDMGALVPENEPCFSPLATYEPIEHVATTTPGTGYFVFTVKNKGPGRYIFCLHPQELPAQKHAVSQCDAADTSGTFFCSMLLAHLPGNAIPLSNGWIRNLLHLGESYYDSLPLADLNEDPFTSTGGEWGQDPQFGDSLYTNGNRYLWSPLEVEDGRFARNNQTPPPFWTQYFAIAIYSPSTQSTVITVRFNTTTRIYVDGVVRFEGYTFFPQIAYSAVFTLEEGWHQVIVKVVYSVAGRAAPEMSIRFDNTHSLSWNYVKPMTDSTDCSNGDRNTACFGETNPTVSHQECVEAGCCYKEDNPIKCYTPGKIRPYRADGRCGPGVPIPSSDFEFAQCNLHSCCSSGYCGRSYANCTCPGCTDHNFVQNPRNQYILWGEGAICSGSRNVHIGGLGKDVCQLRCSRDDKCVAFSQGTPDPYGIADCYLSYGDCTTTVEDARAKVTYRRLTVGCGMTTPVNGGCSAQTEGITLYGEGIEMESCFRSCSLTAQCAVAVYDSKQATCYFSSFNCAIDPKADTIMSHFQCNGEDTKPPVPLPAVPVLPNATLLGCFKDPDHVYFAQPQYPEYPNNHYVNNYLVVSNGDKTACLRHCLEVGALYFALTDGAICTCGVYNNETLLEPDDRVCDKPCLNGDVDKCGGTASASVYIVDTYAGICQYGYSYFQGQCFKLVKDKMSWNESRGYCNREGTTLASIANVTLSQYLLSLAGGEAVWVGGHRIQSGAGNAFSWTDASMFDFTDWLPFEPNGDIPGQREDCILALPSYPTPYQGSWMDAVCTTPQAFVCKIDPVEGSMHQYLHVGNVGGDPPLHCAPKEDFARQTQSSLAGYYLLHKAKLHDLIFADQSNKNHDIELKGTTNPGWASGVKDPETIKFSGTFHIQASSLYNLNSGPFTLAAWVKPENESMSNKVLLSKSYSKEINPVLPLYEWALVFDDRGFLCFVLSSYKACATVALPPNEWIHVAGVYDSVTISLFFNGTFVNKVTVPSSAMVTSNETFVAVGGEYREPATYANNFIGLLDDIRMYEAALGASFVTYLANCEVIGSHGNILPMYERHSDVLDFMGVGFSLKEGAVLSPEPCSAGAEVTTAKVMVIPYTDYAAFFVVDAEMITGGDSIWTRNLCAVSQVDSNIIVGDLHFKVAIVSITTIMNVSASNGLIELSESTSYPLKVKVTGHNLAKGQILILSSKSDCLHGGTLTVTDVKEDGTIGEVELKQAPSASMVFVCWAADSSKAGIRTPFRITTSQDENTAVIDGSKQITSSVIRNGFYDNARNFFKPCHTYDELADNFYVTVSMGVFKDVFIPVKGETVCSLLTSTGTDRFTYSRYAPDELRFTGWVHVVPPYQDPPGAMGGSPIGYMWAAPRQGLSMWGTNYASTALGGCCQSKAGDIPAWGRAYTLQVHPIDENTVWLDWEYPRALSAGYSLYFRIVLRNFRGEVLKGTHRFRIAVGQDIPVEVASGENGVLERFYYMPDSEEGESLKLTVILLENVLPANGNNMSRTLVVDAPIPSPGAALDATNPLPGMLRFGPLDEGIVPPPNVDPFQHDWFFGVERTLRPTVGMSSTAETGHSETYMSTWQIVQADSSGTITVNARSGTLHYFAFAVYISTAGTMTVGVEFSEDMEIYCDGQLIFTTKYNDNENTFFLSFGWHQMLVKAYAGKENAPMKIRVMASGAGWAYSVPPVFPPGTIILTDGEPISRALQLGGEDEYVYGSPNYDTIGDMSTMRPHPGDFTWERLQWLPAQVNYGQWKVEGAKANVGSYALRYIAFALYALRAQMITWVLYCHGPATVWVNGVVAFQCQESETTIRETWLQDLSAGWYQMIVKISAVYQKSWLFSMTPVNTENMILVSYAIGSELPNDVMQLKSRQIITEMLLLQSSEGRGEFLSEIPNLGNEDPSRADIDLTQKISPLSTVAVNVYGEKYVDFSWQPQIRMDGTFGSLTDIVAGNYNQYYSFALYSTGVVGKFSVSYTGGFSIFIDGTFASSAEGGTIHPVPFNLSKGWHTVVFKLTALDNFLWVADSGTTSWSQAMSSCQSGGYSQICNFDAICPYNLKRKTLPDFTASSFVPILPNNADAIEDYVQINADGGDNTSLCLTWSETHRGAGPPWAEDTGAIPQRRGYTCCGFNDGPRIVVQTLYNSGELGLSPAVPTGTLSPPSGEVDNPFSTEQMVTLSHPDGAAEIFYDFTLELKNTTKYRGPFMITTTSTVIFWAVKGEEKSYIQFLQVEIPRVLVLQRRTCPENLPCSIELEGTAPGKHMAFVWEDEPNMDAYKRYATASEIPRSSRTTGIVTVQSYSYMFVPIQGLNAGMYVVFNYPLDDLGRRLSSTVRVDPLRLSPSEVIGHQDTTFNAEGLEKWDGMLFLEQWSGGPVSCKTSNCISAFVGFMPHVGVVTEDSKVMVDLHEFSGNIHCLCVCVTGSLREKTEGYFFFDSDFVSAVPVNISVTAPPTPTKDTVQFISPKFPRDGEEMIFGGYFTSSSPVTYNVLFQPKRTDNAVRPPTCRVMSVNQTTLLCSVSVSVGTFGNWSSEMYKGEAAVTYAGAVNELVFSPPDQAVSGAYGECATRSSACVDGAEITFMGINFDHHHPTRNTVRLVSEGQRNKRTLQLHGPRHEALDEENQPRCVTVAVTETTLTCRLENTTFVPMRSSYGVELNLRLTDDFSRRYPTNGSLLLKGGALPGWSGAIVPTPPSNAPASASNNKLIIALCVVIGVLVIMGIAVALCVKCRYNLRRKSDGEEEMSFMEEQLLRAEQESTASLRRNMLNSPIPPLKEGERQPRQSTNLLNEL